MGIASQLAVGMVLMGMCRLEARAGSWGCPPVLPQPSVAPGAGPTAPSPGAQSLLAWGAQTPKEFPAPWPQFGGFSVVCCDQIPLPMEPGPLVCCLMPSWTCAPPSAVALPSFHTFPRQIFLEKMTINVVFLGFGNFSPLPIRVRGSTLAQSGVQ